MTADSAEHTQEIREHLSQFSLHVLLVFATGLTIGSERTVVPVLGRDVLGIESLFRRRYRASRSPSEAPTVSCVSAIGRHLHWGVGAVLVSGLVAVPNHQYDAV